MAPPLHKAIQDPRKFAAMVDRYIETCLIKDDSGKDDLISLVGLALSIGCDKDSLLRWSQEDALLEHDPGRSIYGAIKKAKLASEQQLQRSCYKDRNAMSLALAKCMYGYVEQQHVKHEHAGGLQLVVSTGVPSPDTDTP